MGNSNYIFYSLNALFLKSCTIFLVFIGISSLFAQSNGAGIQTVRNNNFTSLVKEVFIKGACKNVSNIKGLGEDISFGAFDKGENIIGFPDGIILSTGDVKSAEGPNNSIETSTRFARNSTDKDLVSIATNQLFDVTVLEFDFVPVSDEVTFQYVFASEEYCEFVGTIFNDVFGFFVSGPGINGPFSNAAINVARLPDSDDFVSINSVNHELNRDSYVGNELEADANNCRIPFNPNHPNSFEYDGFTIPLTARFPVIPCETYHIRLVVGDVGDDKLDSAVFLRSRSFDLGELASVKAIGADQSETTAYENCLDGQFIFTRPEDSNINEDLKVDFEIESTSTAIEGIDFEPVARTITIPAGQNSMQLPIQSIEDAEPENAETLTLELFQTCECAEGNRATLTIVDAPIPVLNFPVFEACSGKTFELVPEVIGGIKPFSYQWNDQSTEKGKIITLEEPSSFALTITDICGNRAIDSILIGLQDIPTATLSGELDYCDGTLNVALPLDFTGYPPWSFSYFINGDSLFKIDSVYDKNFGLPVSGSGLYELISFSDAACMGTVTGSGYVNDTNIEVRTEYTPPDCPNDKTGSIQLELITITPPYEIKWSVPVDDPLNPMRLGIGEYTVSITDALGCTFSKKLNLESPAETNPDCDQNVLYIPNAFSPNGDGINDFFEVFFSSQNATQQILETEIYDRWGNLVYQTKNKMPVWNGHFRGKKLHPAVFIYKIQLALKNGKVELYEGSVHLLE